MARPLPSFCLHWIKSSGSAAPLPIRAKEEAAIAGERDNGKVVK
jgi:hypothetical protein